MFLDKYQNRPSTLKIDRHIDQNGRTGNVHSLNEFDITVWSDGEVTAKRKYYTTTDPTDKFPNMMFSDGVLSFPIEDLVGFILERITPHELAEGIIADDEARAALVDKMAELYNTPGFSDWDRREFLTKVQQQVYAVAVNNAIEALNRAEEGQRASWDYYRWKKVETGQYRNIYEYVVTLLGTILKDDPLSEKRLIAFRERYKMPDELDAYIDQGRDPVVKESVGENWYESRDYWRKRLEEIITPPREK